MYIGEKVDSGAMAAATLAQQMQNGMASAQVELTPAAGQDLEAASPQNHKGRPPHTVHLSAWPAHGAALPPTVHGQNCNQHSSSSTAAQRQALPWWHIWRYLGSWQHPSSDAHRLSQERPGADGTALPAHFLPRRPPAAAQVCHSESLALTVKSMLARQRWQRACRAVVEGRQVARCLELLTDRLAPRGDRLHAVVVLKMRLAACTAPKRHELTSALLAQGRTGTISWGEHVGNELYRTGRWGGSNACQPHGKLAVTCAAAATSQVPTPVHPCTSLVQVSSSLTSSRHRPLAATAPTSFRHSLRCLYCCFSSWRGSTGSTRHWSTPAQQFAWPPCKATAQPPAGGLGAW